MKKIIIFLLAFMFIFFIGCTNSTDNKPVDPDPTDPVDPVDPDPTDPVDPSDEKRLESIEMGSLGKTEYTLGEEFELKGFSVKVIYNTGFEVVDLTSDMLTIDMRKAGTIEASVSFTFEKVTKTTSFTVTIVEVKPLSLECIKEGKTIYWSGLTFDLTGFEFECIYTDGTKTRVNTNIVQTSFNGFSENETDDPEEVEIEVFATIDGVVVEGIVKVINYSEWIYEEKEIEENDKLVTNYANEFASVPDTVTDGTKLEFMTASDLPVNGYIVVWTSNRAENLDSTGNVVADEDDREVVMLLKIRRGTTTVFEKEFNVLVKGLGPVQFLRFDPTKKHIFAYSYSGTFISLTDDAARKIDFYNYCFASIGDDHRLSVSGLGHLKEVLGYRRKYGIRVILSVQKGPWAEIASNEAYLSIFTRSVIDIIDEYHFDGIDIDWEFPQAGTQQALFTKIIKATREAMDAYKEGLFLTCALIGGGSVSNVKQYYECDKIKDYIDFAHIMTYDLNVSSQASHHTNPLAGRAYSVAGSISFYTGAGMPSEKIVIGAAFYGKISELSSPYDAATPNVLNKPVVSTSAIKYSSIKTKYMTDPTYVEYFDSNCGAYYLTNGHYFITYDTPQSIHTKGELVSEKGLAGMMFWDLGSDSSFELLGAVFDVICEINSGRI